jgi:RNA polymerase sigma-70 factor (ECF subfamily)
MPADPGDHDDRTRFEALWNQGYADVFAYALRRLGDEAAARDAASDTFLIAWRRLDDVPAEPRPWLFGVARRVIANARRGDGRRDALVARLGREPAGTDPAASDDPHSPVAAAFNRLGASDREVLSLVVWEELKPREAARVLGISAPLLSVRLHRAKQRLRKELERAGHEPGTDPKQPQAEGSGPGPTAVQLETR